MRFLCLVSFEPQTLAALSPTEKAALNRNSLAYNDELTRNNHYITAEALQPVGTARTVRVRGLMIPSLGILNKPCEQPGSDGPNGGLSATKSAALAPSSSPSSSNSEQPTGSGSSLQNPSPPVISLPQSLLFLHAGPQDAALQV